MNSPLFQNLDPDCSIFCDEKDSSSKISIEGNHILEENTEHRSTLAGSTSVQDRQELHHCTNSISNHHSFSGETGKRRQSRWNQTRNGGTVLSDPVFQSNNLRQIDIEYRPLLPKSRQHHRLSSSKQTFTSGSKMDSFDSFNKDLKQQKKMMNKDFTENETSRLMDPNCVLLEHDEDKFDGENPGINLWNLYKGIFYSSLSSVFFSLSAVIVKYLKDIHPGQLAVCRFFGIFVLTIPMIVYNDLNPFGPAELRPILIMRGIAGATSLFLRFISFHYLPIADASVIIFSVPVFVSIFAWVYLKEPCGLFHTITIMIAMVGLIMTTKLPTLFGTDSSMIYTKNYYLYSHQTPEILSTYPNGTSTAAWMNQPLTAAMPQQTQKLNHLYGVMAALSSLIFSSSVFIFIRKAKCAHHAVIMFNFGWVAILETTIITSILNGFSMPRTPFEWYLIVVLSVFSFCGQILLTRSLQLEQAGPVSVVRATTDIALAFVWQLIIFKEVPDAWSICGALVVSSCIVLTALHKWVLSLPEHSRLRERLNFLLI